MTSLTGKKSFTLFQILVATTILVIVGLSFATVAKVAADICYRCYAYSKMYEISFRIKEAVKRDLESVVIGSQGAGALQGYSGTTYKRSSDSEFDELYLVGKTYDGPNSTKLAELGWWVYNNELMHYVVDYTSPYFNDNFDVFNDDSDVIDILEGSANITDNSYINLTSFKFYYYPDETLSRQDEWIGMMQKLPELIKLEFTLTGKRKIKNTDESSKLSKTFSYLFHLPQSTFAGFGP